MMSNLPRILAAALLALLIWLAWSEHRKPERPAGADAALLEDGTRKPEPDSGYRNPAIFFTYVIFISVAAGAMVIKWVIPAMGDRMAESLYSSPEKAEATPTQKALALVAQGEYQQALAAFQKIVEESPHDRFAVTEMARLHMDKLSDLDAGIRVMEHALTREWGGDDHCFLLLKLADIHSSRMNDYDGARALLAVVQSKYPNTHHAANAHHKLHEIDEAEYLARRHHR
jgi:tetratricopeptide (TPR) repeat protein